MNDETARRDLSASAYRTYEYWRVKKKKSPQRAYDLALMAFNDNDEYQARKKEVSE